MADATGPSWTPLGSIETKRLEKRFGPASGKVVREIVLLRPTEGLFGLDKKVFRGALRACLPRDHRIATVVGLSVAEQALRAARAYVRLRAEQALVPALPLEVQGEQFLLWSSYCLKPRAAEPLGLEILCAPREELSDAVLELWSRIFLASRLRNLSPGLGRAEVAIGLVALDDELLERVSRLLAREALSGPETDSPFPSLRLGGEPFCALESSFLDFVAKSWGKALPKIERKGAREPVLVIRGGQARVSGASFRELLEGREDELERHALGLVLGEPHGGAPVKEKARGQALKEARKLVRAIWDLLLRAPEAARLEARKSALGERVQARATWMREMDLGILPDDGLKQTLEELADLTAKTAALSAESELLAALHGTSYLALTGLDLSVLDAGLELPTLPALLAFEEAMTRVRVDPLATAALMRGDAPESGPGQRALASFYREHREIFGRGPDSVLPASLFEAARVALTGPVFLEAELREAQVNADRKIAAFEERHVRSVGASLSPLRAQARGLVMIREAARALEVRVSEMVIFAASDIDRRLPRLEPGIEPFAAYHATCAELLATVDMTGPALRARTIWRKADARFARPGTSGEPFAHPFVGLALRRALPELLRLAYETGPLRYAGRAADTLACSARMLGRSVVIV